MGGSCWDSPVCEERTVAQPASHCVFTSCLLRRCVSLHCFSLPAHAEPSERATPSAYDEEAASVSPPAAAAAAAEAANGKPARAPPPSAAPSHLPKPPPPSAAVSKVAGAAGGAVSGGVAGAAAQAAHAQLAGGAPKMHERVAVPFTPITLVCRDLRCAPAWLLAAWRFPVPPSASGTPNPTDPTHSTHPHHYSPQLLRGRPHARRVCGGGAQHGRHEHRGQAGAAQRWAGLRWAGGAPGALAWAWFVCPLVCSSTQLAVHCTASLPTTPAPGISFYACPGELTALMGGSGAGKTTLMVRARGRQRSPACGRAGCLPCLPPCEPARALACVTASASLTHISSRTWCWGARRWGWCAETSW